MSKKQQKTEIENEVNTDTEQAAEVETTEVSEYDLLKKDYDALADKLLRNSAELENFKRRTNEEKQNFMKYATQGVMLDLVGVIDNFDLALKNLESNVDENVYSGIKMIFEQLSKLMENNGVEVIESVGKVFDPNMHQAVMTGNDDSMESGYVIEEFQKGYKMKDKILRPAMVKVNE